MEPRRLRSRVGPSFLGQRRLEMTRARGRIVGGAEIRSREEMSGEGFASSYCASSGEDTADWVSFDSLAMA